MANKLLFNALTPPFDLVRDSLADLTTRPHSALTNLVSPADDHTQYLLLAGRTGGQKIGTPTGINGATDDIFMSGRFILSPTASAISGVKLIVQDNISTGFSGSINFVRITPSITVSGSSIATFRAFFVTMLGGGNINNGSPNFETFNLAVAPSINSGVSNTNITAFNLLTTLNPATQNNSIQQGSALKLTVQGSAGYQGNIITTNYVVPFDLSYQPNAINIQNAFMVRGSTTATAPIKGVTNHFNFLDTGGLFTSQTYFGNSSVSATVTNGSNLLVGVGSAITNMCVGMLLTGTGIPAKTYITAIDTNLLTVTMSNAAVGNGSSVLFWGALTSYDVIDDGNIGYPDNIRLAHLINSQSGANSIHLGKISIGSTNEPAYTCDVTGDFNCTGAIRTNAIAGITVVITTAQLTALGTQGSMTFTNGILTAQIQAT